MKKIRQRNDIDIVVQLKNNEGLLLDPTLCSDMIVCLTCGSKKFYINDFEKFADGRIKFRFLAEKQTKLGVHNVTISAVTEDGRTFTTDACNAFNLVACSCNASDDAGEVNVESVEVDATFEISAWGMVSDIVTYEIPSRWTEVGKQYQITQDNFHDIFGSEDELLKNLENKHVRLKIFGTDESAKIIIDVTTSLQAKFPSETSVTYIINFNGIASNDVEDFLTVYALDVRCGIGIDKLTDGTYSFVGGSFEIIKKENSVTTEEIAELERKVDKIVYHWDDLDLSVPEGTVSQDVYDNLLKADVVTTKGFVFTDKWVDDTSIALTLRGLTGGGEEQVACDLFYVTVKEDLTYTIESFGYNLPSEDFVDKKLSAKQDILVSGENIKTINNQSILGEGNITIEGGSGVADVGITGTLNVTDPISIAAAQNLITKPYGVAFYLITDSNGKLPSKNQEAVQISAAVEKFLSFRSPNPTVNNILEQVSIDNFKPRGFNVGDIIALSRVPVGIDALVEYLGLSSAIATALKLLGLSEIEIYQYKIWTTNDAKWSNFQNKDGSVVAPGVKGLMSVWDKEQVDKVPNLENIATANDLSTKYAWGTNFNACLNTGVLAYGASDMETSPLGIVENYTLVVQRSSTADSSGYYSIIQTAYGRTGVVYNRIFQRMIFHNPTTGANEYHKWVELTNTSSGGSTTYFRASCAPNVIFSTLEAAKVNGFAEVSSETEDGVRGYTFKGYFNFVPTDDAPYYMGVGMITYHDTNLSEPAIMVAHPYHPTQIIQSTRLVEMEEKNRSLTAIVDKYIIDNLQQNDYYLTPTTNLEDGASISQFTSLAFIFEEPVFVKEKKDGVQLYNEDGDIVSSVNLNIRINQSNHNVAEVVLSNGSLQKGMTYTLIVFEGVIGDSVWYIREDKGRVMPEFAFNFTLTE